MSGPSEDKSGEKVEAETSNGSDSLISEINAE